MPGLGLPCHTTAFLGHARYELAGGRICHVVEELVRSTVPQSGPNNESEMHHHTPHARGMTLQAL